MDVLKHRHKAVELALVQAGYSLDEIRGGREVHRTEERPTGLWAAVNRVTPRSARVALAGILALGLLAAYETAMLSPLAASIVLGVGFYLLGEVEADTVEIEHEVEREGMTYREAQERLIQWNEWQRIEAEKKKEAAKNAEKRAGNAQPRR